MDLLIVLVVIGAALGYAGWKAWGLFKPGAKGGSCGCSSAGKGCAGCAVADLKGAVPRK
jgi:putative effector of murein hydrolase